MLKLLFRITTLSLILGFSGSAVAQFSPAMTDKEAELTRSLVLGRVDLV